MKQAGRFTEINSPEQNSSVLLNVLQRSLNTHYWPISNQIVIFKYHGTTSISCNNCQLKMWEMFLLMLFPSY
jgi:hypothetical protein